MMRILLFAQLLGFVLVSLSKQQPVDSSGLQVPLRAAFVPDPRPWQQGRQPATPRPSYLEASPDSVGVHFTAAGDDFSHLWLPLGQRILLSMWPSRSSPVLMLMSLG